MGVGMIQESISWVKIKLHVDFQPTSFLGSTPERNLKDFSLKLTWAS